MKQISIVKVTLLSLALGSSQIGLAATSGIPNQFHGRWGSPDQCSGNGENPTKISAKDFKGHESLCVLKKTLKSDDLNFEGSFMCSGEGEEWEDKISLKRVKDRLIINDGEATPKCK
jgi:hypothetical protein